MSTRRSCLQCGEILPGDAALGLCPICVLSAAPFMTVTHNPAATPEATGPAASRHVVDVAEFQALDHRDRTDQALRSWRGSSCRLTRSRAWLAP